MYNALFLNEINKIKIMKNKSYSVFVMGGLIALIGWTSIQKKQMASAKTGDETSYTIDSTASQLKWKGSAFKDGKIDHSHHGTIAISSGILTKNKKGYSGDFEVDIASIKNTDLKDASKINLLVGKLKGFNFFNVSICPKVKVNVQSISDNKAILTVTEFDISVMDTVPISLKMNNNKATLSGNFAFNFTAMKMPAFGIDKDGNGISPNVQFSLNAVMDEREIK